MGKSNGKSEAEELDLEHELPPAEEDAQPGQQSQHAQDVPEQSELSKLKLERDALLDRLARQQAEFENARKRAAREQQEHRDYALVEAIRQILPIVDSFDRALKNAPRDGGEFLSGVQLINKQLHDLLAKLGVKPVPAEGQPFDPKVHEAIQMVETSEAEDNHVLQELQRGYQLKDRLLRPAMVTVARNSKKPA